MIIIMIIILTLFQKINGLDSNTIATISSNKTICGIIASKSNQQIQCYQNNKNNTILIQPNISFNSISGGGNFFCGLRSNGVSLLCWDIINGFSPKRVYFNSSSPLREISVGNDQVCGIFNSTNKVHCWRGMNKIGEGTRNDEFRSISCGYGFVCGILMNSGRVSCWGSNESLARLIESSFDGILMDSIVSGVEHVCGFDLNGNLVCKGRNLYGELDFDVRDLSVFKGLAVGFGYSCGVRGSNGSVVCWGGVGYLSNVTNGVSFETIVGGHDFVCGLVSSNLSIVCWGPGWLGRGSVISGIRSKVIPGPCVRSECSECGVFPDSESLCSGSGHVCNTCVLSRMPPLPSPQPPSSNGTLPSSPRTSKGLRKGLLAFAIVGSVGGLAGICSVIYCLYTGVCWGRKKIHNSVQPTITRGGSSTGRTSSNSPPSRSLTIRRQDSWVMRMKRQRSGTSSTKHADRSEEFTFQELALATDNFSVENRIGSGSFGVVYRGKLYDGREVAIKRGETGPKAKKFQEKESAFESELAFLSRLHHKHLVRLVGYCEERDERLLVYEYMKNGALHGHLHGKNNVEKHSSVINSWKTRIRIALDAARGIEYLHNYAVPPIIHRDIKSSNILLDANWIARVSDFGLSMMGPESERGSRPLRAAGTLGYIDPEYYGLNVLTDKSDVYGFGVVLLELITGKKAIFKGEDDDGTPMSVVDFAVPAIMEGELVKILDPRVGPPDVNDSEAIELVSYTALHCVNLEGKDRPTMADIVANLERALALCEESHGSISSIGISTGSD